MYDIAIVGGGPGGYAAGLYAHNFDLSVALISDEPPGGTCIHRGCIPAKQWLYVADVFRTVEDASDFGVVTSAPEIDWAAALDKKNDTVNRIVKGLEGTLTKRNVEVVLGRGRLDGPGKVVVSGDEGERVIEASHVIMATGSYPRSLPGYDFDGRRIVSSREALDWESRPDRVAVIGGGVIGCEFASLLVDLGSEVHVFELMDQILPGSDPDVAKVLNRQLSRRGVKFHTGIGVNPPEITDSAVVIPYGDESVEVDVVLVAVGRGARTDGVGFETTKAEIEREFVKVDLVTMQTAESGVYAIGDIVAGTPQLAHAGYAEAIAAVTHIATGETAPVDYRAIPRVTYTHPEVAEVGLTEIQAEEQGLEVESHTHFFNGVGRAMIMNENQGIAKVIAQKDGPIVGAAVVGPHAGELVHELMYSVGWEALPSEAAAFVHAHPTLSEAVGETLLASSGRSLH